MHSLSGSSSTASTPIVMSTCCLHHVKHAGQQDCPPQHAGHQDWPQQPVVPGDVPITRNLRVLTWNVNGLRPCSAKFGGIGKLLDFLNADIICFQEHKLRRGDLDRDLALVDGWESFFSFSHKNVGYSGVATYCKRLPGVLPTQAEEGLTGVMALQPAHRAQLLSDPRWQGLTVADLVAMDQEGRVMITHHSGHLVVINLYGVAITNEETAEERRVIKMRLCQALESRIHGFLAAGCRVCVVGDFNICPKPIDHRQPEDEERWCSRDPGESPTAWLHHLSWEGPGSGGPLVDTFRMFHPNRMQAFTCWSTASGARINNWGSRIDLLLAGGPGAVMGQAARDSVATWVVGGDIWPEVQGSDHAPAWVDLQLPVTTTTATATVLPPPLPLSTRAMFAPVKQVKLTQWVGRGGVAGEQGGRPSSVAAEDVVVGVQAAAAAAAAGAAAVSRAPGDGLVNGGTGSSIELGSTGSAPLPTCDDEMQTHTTSMTSHGQLQSVYHDTSAPLTSACVSQQANGSVDTRSLPPDTGHLLACAAVGPTGMQQPTTCTQPPITGIQQPTIATASTVNTSTSSSSSAGCRKRKSGGAAEGGTQAKLTAFLKPTSSTQPLQRLSGSQPVPLLPALPPPRALQLGAACHTLSAPLPLARDGEGWSDGHGGQPALAAGSNAHAVSAGPVQGAAMVQSGVAQGHGTGAGLHVQRGSGGGGGGGGDAAAAEAPVRDRHQAKEAWKAIQDRMKPPNCSGHNEPAVIRQVKKAGPSHGRLFYVCARADGPPPHGRCDFFKWADNRVVPQGERGGAGSAATAAGGAQAEGRAVADVVHRA